VRLFNRLFRMGESDYLPVRTSLSLRKEKLDIFPFFFILKERMFFLSLDKRAG